jgi:3'-phosphoadenosine 5'-phosphosulfate sulfotransferase (PAPS reductase)/FAD synthetase
VDGSLAHSVDLRSYDRIVVAFSGGKDSMACLLHLLDSGVDPSRIELWHHEVDGREGSRMMDWPVTPAYCRAVAAAFGLKLRFSWKVGGFEREMLRDGVPTGPSKFEMPDGTVMEVGGKGDPGTRLKFPQVSADLTVRWCSAYLKIDVADKILTNDPDFVGARTLIVTGERAEESAARAKYQVFEPHRADLRDGKRKPRHVDQLRIVHAWSREQVWEIMERWRVRPHPAYMIGWGRLSCAACIFGSADQWASLRAVNPAQFERVAAYEARFGTTIQRSASVVQLADRGAPYPAISDPANAEDVRLALSEDFDLPVFMLAQDWRTPAGAYASSHGPT